MDFNPQSIPTSSRHAEICLIGLLIADSAHLPMALARLSPEDFVDPVGRAIFSAMGEMARKNLIIDGPTLAAYLNASGVAKLTGAINLDAIEGLAIPPVKVEQYITLIQDFSRTRRYLNLARAIQERVLSHRPGDPSLDATLPAFLTSNLSTLQPSAFDPSPGDLESTAAKLCARPLSGPAWLLDGLFLAGGLNLLAGEVSSGKTFLALDLALTVASGGCAWDNRQTIHGPVLYFSLDCSPRNLQKRVQALCLGRNIPPPKELLLNFSQLSLAEPAGLAFLRRRAASTHVCLVIFDVLARYMPGVDENSVSSVGPVMTALRSFTNNTGCSVLILHHYNKGVGYSPQASQGLRVRGSTDITAAMDTVVTLTVAGPRTAPTRTIMPEKNRDLPEAGPLSFTILPVPIGNEAAQHSPVGEAGATSGAGLILEITPLSNSGPGPKQIDRLLKPTLEVLRAYPGRVLTRRQIDEALNRKGIFYSHRTLERLLADIDMQPGIRVGKSGNAHTYTWNPS